VGPPDRKRRRGPEEEKHPVERADLPPERSPEAEHHLHRAAHREPVGGGELLVERRLEADRRQHRQRHGDDRGLRAMMIV
jgi:hypothetical protein